MSELAAGHWPCKVIDGHYGDNEKNIPVIRINVELTDGPGKGMRQTYEEQVNNRSAPYVARTCKAVGWRGNSLSTLSGDIAAWIAATSGVSTLEIKHIQFTDRKTGERRVWAKPSSIGSGPKPLKESSKENLYDADAAMRAALAEDAKNGAPPDEAQLSGDDDLPFISSSMTFDRAVMR